MELESDVDLTGGIVFKEEVFETADGVTVFLQAIPSAGELDTSDATSGGTAHLESLEDPLSLCDIGKDESWGVKVEESEVKIEIVENEIIPEPSTGGADILHCHHCAYTCLGEYVLDNHMRSRHGHIGGNGRYKCDKCAYSTDRLSNMKDHQVTHTGERPFPCDRCDKVFALRRHLTQHFRTIHDGLRLHSCRVCGKAFTQVCHLTIHQRIHSGTSVVQCEQCGKQFNVRSHYIRHMKSHDGVKAHKCQECTARFVTRSDLTKHMRTHTGERPYACTHCSAAFATHSNMKNHIISEHTHDYKHRCERCGKGFIAPSKLRKHSNKCTS